MITFPTDKLILQNVQELQSYMLIATQQLLAFNLYFSISTRLICKVLIPGSILLFQNIRWDVYYV